MCKTAASSVASVGAKARVRRPRHAVPRRHDDIRRDQRAGAERAGFLLVEGLLGAERVGPAVGLRHQARGADAKLMRRLADNRVLMPKDLKRASPEVVRLLRDWLAAGWISVHRLDK